LTTSVKFEALIFRLYVTRGSLKVRRTVVVPYRVSR